MTAQNNKHTVRRYFAEALLDGRTNLIEELFAPEICDLVRRYAYFAPGSISINDIVAEEDIVMVHWSTHLLSEPRFDPNGFAVCHLKDGMIVGLAMMHANGISYRIGAMLFSSEPEESR
jgi:hypothetical protein